MTHIVIIGAGPSGLYLINKLIQKGLKDIRIFDPRAGNYTRPGAIDDAIFDQAEKGLNAVLPPKKSDHIRNIEKSLYQYSVSQNIVMEKKEFVRFAEDKKGIIVSNIDKNNNNFIEEFIACDYVFDCTGTKRASISAINRLNELKGIPKFFELTPISQDVVIKNHLIAHIKLDENTILLADNRNAPENNLLFNRTPLQYVKSIERLRQFGWSEFAFPYCYNTPFKDGKTCVYVECPDNLPASQQEAWLRTVLEVVTNQATVQFEHLTSRNGNHRKPNFCAFSVNPQRLNHFTYQEPGMPSIVVFGDGQVEPNYTLGHGIRGAFKRIDIFSAELLIYKEKIVYLNLANYDHNVNTAIKKHEQDIVMLYQYRKHYFERAVYAAKSFYKLALSQAINEEEFQCLSKSLNEILARTSYYLIRDVRNSQGQPGTFGEFLTRRDLIIKSIDRLTYFEQQEAQGQLQQLVNTFTKFGKELFQKGHFAFAIKAYEEALAIYSMHRKMKQEDKFSLYEEIVLNYRKLNQLKNVFTKVQEALNQPEKPSETIKKRILFHFVKATYENLRSSDSPEQQLKVLIDFAKIYKPQQDFIDNYLAINLTMELKTINQIMISYNLDASISTNLLNEQRIIQIGANG